MNIKNQFPFALPEALQERFNDLVKSGGTTTINFRDKSYSKESGGFRPVEMQIERQGDQFYFNYITEFAYFYDDFCKSVDFEFSCGEFFTIGLPNYRPIGADELEYLELYLNNLSSYLDCELLDEIKTSFDDITTTLF